MTRPPGNRPRRLAARCAIAAIAATLTAAALGAPVAANTAPPDSSSPSSMPTATRLFETPNGPVEIPADPQRIVACGYATFPLLQAEANLVASCEWTRELEDMTAEVRAIYDALPRVGADADISTLNYEAIAAADPDLIIMGVPVFALEQMDMGTLQDLAPVVLFGPTRPGDWRAFSVQFADAAGVTEAYSVFVDEYEHAATDIAARYEALGDLTFGGVCTRCPGDAGTFFREYASSYTSNLFDDLGFSFPGTPADPDGPQHGERLSLEELVDSFADVDVITYGVEADGSIPAAATELFASPLWQALPAVQAGNVVPVQHHAASTHATAILALESIDASLAALPILDELTATTESTIG